MLSFLRKLWKPAKPPLSEAEGKERDEKGKAILMAELSRTTIDGKPVTHRRLESLMLAVNLDKAETIRLLRELGARPSRRRGLKLWTRE